MTITEHAIARARRDIARVDTLLDIARESGDTRGLLEALRDAHVSVALAHKVGAPYETRTDLEDQVCGRDWSANAFGVDSEADGWTIED